MISISVETYIDEALKFLGDLERSVAPQAASAAINRVAVSARAEAIREISRETGLTQTEIRQRLNITTANRNTLTAKIIARPWSPNLIRFNARQTQPGVSAAPWRKRRVHKHTFIANKGRTVFVREGKARLPLKSVRGPSVRKEFMRGYAIRAMERKVAERFGLEFDRALRAIMVRKGWR